MNGELKIQYLVLPSFAMNAKSLILHINQYFVD
jgi:hypothetical protein